MNICKKVPQKQPETEVKKASVSGFWQQEQNMYFERKEQNTTRPGISLLFCTQVTVCLYSFIYVTLAARCFLSWYL